MIDYDRIPYTPKVSTGEHVRMNAFYNPVDEPETHGGRYERRKPMDDYISRQDAITAACKGFCHPGARCPETPCREQTKYLRGLPPADVVPVVRCRDCRYHVAIDKCCHPDGLLCAKDNNFCSYGERKE